MMNALGHIRQLDYTVIYARDLPAMRHFYEKVMEFPVINVLSERWIEFGIGSTRLARHCADGQPQSGKNLPVDVRADPRFRLRHHR